jgi:hypothetical protein
MDATTANVKVDGKPLTEEQVRIIVLEELEKFSRAISAILPAVVSNMKGYTS